MKYYRGMNKIMRISNTMRAAMDGLNRRMGLAVLVAALLLPTKAVSQAMDASDDPLTTVQQFKNSLDADNVSTMCKLMAESDGSGPLSRLHFEKMQSSMSELIKLWQYTSFAYGGSEINTGKTPFQATVRVIASQLKQEVKFTLLKFGSNWYISDIEIYFK